MSLNLPFEILYLLYLLKQNGFQAFLVGGAVRDLMMQVPLEKIKDYDLATDATPAEIQAILPNSFYENQFGTVILARS